MSERSHSRSRSSSTRTSQHDHGSEGGDVQRWLSGSTLSGNSSQQPSLQSALRSITNHESEGENPREWLSRSNLSGNSSQQARCQSALQPTSEGEDVPGWLSRLNLSGNPSQQPRRQSALQPTTDRGPPRSAYDNNRTRNVPSEYEYHQSEASSSCVPSSSLAMSDHDGSRHDRSSQYNGASSSARSTPWPHLAFDIDPEEERRILVEDFLARNGSRGSGLTGSTLASVEGGRSLTTASSAAGNQTPSATGSQARRSSEFGGASEYGEIASSTAVSSTMATRAQSRAGSQAPGSSAFDVPSRYGSVDPFRDSFRASFRASIGAPSGAPSSYRRRLTLRKYARPFHPHMAIADNPVIAFHQ